MKTFDAATHKGLLKNGVNEADSASVVNVVTSHVKFGRQMGGHGNPKNNMVAANASRRRK